VQSGESATFLEVGVMLRFLRRFGVEASDSHTPAPDEG
jgi:hypothetical protein